MIESQFDSMGWRFWGRFWMDGVNFAGVGDLITVSKNAKIFDSIKKMGARSSHNGQKGDKLKTVGHWELLHIDIEKKPHHADDMAIAQVFWNTMPAQKILRFLRARSHVRKQSNIY